MRTSRKQRRQKKSSALPIIGWISAVLLVSIIAVFGYKTYFTANQDAPDDTTLEEQPVKAVEPVEQKMNEATSTTTDEEKTVEKPVEKPAIGPGGYIENQPVPTEPTFIDGILIANKLYPLPSTYNPGESPEAKSAFDQMAQAALAEGHELVAFSGFRSYEYQTTLYNNYVSRDGQENADRYSARPGYSEHQTGLAFDIGEKGQEDLWLTEEFGETPAGLWLVENAHKYGFILRYPKGKEDVTGFMYESWHFRYLGAEVATEIYEAGITLEEYLNIQP